MKTEKLAGVAGGEGECGDDVAGWLVRERQSLDILPVKKEAKLSASEVPDRSENACAGTPVRTHRRTNRWKTVLPPPVPPLTFSVIF